MVSKILYGIYFFIWSVFIAVAYAYVTNRFYLNVVFLAPLLGFVLAVITILALLLLVSIYLLNPLGRKNIKRRIVLCLIPMLFLIPAVIIYFSPNRLEEKVQTIRVRYIAWACDCANWVLLSDYEKYNNAEDQLAERSIFIEPSKKVPSFEASNNDVIEITGRFYKRKGFPKGFNSFENPEKARVFRYTKFKQIKGK